MTAPKTPQPRTFRPNPEPYGARETVRFCAEYRENWDRSQSCWETALILVRQALAFFLVAGIGLAISRTSVAGGAIAEAPRPNIVLIVADDLGYSDLGCYGGEVETPNLDRLAAGGLRWSQFYNAARCCPTRAALLTGRYPHQVGVGHMLSDWRPPHYTAELAAECWTLAELLGQAGYRCYHLGKWHVGSVAQATGRNFPLQRGFERAYGTGGGGNYSRPRPLYLDRESAAAGPDFYITDALADYAERFLTEHDRSAPGQPFFVHLCFTAPHFPLQARPDEIAKYRGRYRQGWGSVRSARLARQHASGLLGDEATLSPPAAEARAWESLTEDEHEHWDLLMAIYAAMIERMDQAIGRVLAAVDRMGATENTLVLFLSDNGASAEALDSWPEPARGHRPGSAEGSADSHRCLEAGWANAANTPWRDFKMLTHEGGIATPLVAYWPAGIRDPGRTVRSVGHVIDMVPTCAELAGWPAAAATPATNGTETVVPSKQRDAVDPAAVVASWEGRSLVPELYDPAFTAAPRTLAWEHEGNRAIRIGDWKLVAPWRGAWELYDLAHDRSETLDLEATQPDRVRAMSAAWQAWADRVGVVPWEELPGANYRPTDRYRKYSEPISPQPAKP